MKEIELTQGKVALVDDEDYEWLNRYTWCASISSNKFYAITGTYKVRMHRLIFKLTDPKIEVDHIDGDGLNNQRSNIRLATRSQNSANVLKRINCSSIYKGVYFHRKNNKWHSRIMKDYKQINLGSFDSEVEAALEYDRAAKKYMENLQN